MFDVINRKEKPNILIVCSGSSCPSWYTSLLMGQGLDFKFLSGARDAVMYYSKELSNLFIVSEEVLADAEIFLEYAYAFLLQKPGEACLIIRVPDNDAAEAALAAAGIGIAKQEDLF